MLDTLARQLMWELRQLYPRYEIFGTWLTPPTGHRLRCVTQPGGGPRPVVMVRRRTRPYQPLARIEVCDGHWVLQLPRRRQQCPLPDRVLRYEMSTPRSLQQLHDELRATLDNVL